MWFICPDAKTCKPPIGSEEECRHKTKHKKYSSCAERCTTHSESGPCEERIPDKIEHEINISSFEKVALRGYYLFV